MSGHSRRLGGVRALVFWVDLCPPMEDGVRMNYSSYAVMNKGQPLGTRVGKVKEERGYVNGDMKLSGGQGDKNDS